MKTVVLGPLPAELEDLIERRKRLGQDLYDEIWEGTYHMAPAPRWRHSALDDQLAQVLGPLAKRSGLVGGGPFNLGEPGNFRVPDHGYLRGHPDPEAVYVPTAAVVVEIVSPGDETWEKLPFYAARRVEELLVVDPEDHRVRMFALERESGEFAEADHSVVLGMSALDLEMQLWG